MLAIAMSLTTFAQVPQYSSSPSSSAVLFLDFDGHTVAGTGWNMSGPIFCGPSGLNTEQITTIFNRVAEDYRPFDINITTDSTKYLSAPIEKRMRVILTVTSSWYGSAGGVAFVNSFRSGDDTPCFVFTALLGYNLKNISEAAAHEAGHTLGLYHQATYDSLCNKTSDYHFGQGSGEIGWAPIMGVGYYQNFTLWNLGQSSMGCYNIQSDLDVITQNNGFSFRADDYPSTFAAATQITMSGTQFLVDGIIEKNTDQDMIKFVVPAFGRFELNAVPYNVGTGNAGSNLDLQVTLFNAAQTTISTYNPGSLLNSVADTMLNPGTYYLRVEGRGNIYAPNYASLGSYSLQGNYTDNTTLPLRVLLLNGETVGNKHKLSWVIDADEQVIEQVLEISTDGINFSTVIQSNAGERTYMYQPMFSSTVQYRLNVTFDNGKRYYSNTITLRKAGSEPKPKLVSTLINSTDLSVTSPGNYDYLIYDLNGRTMGKGTIRNGYNLINASAINVSGVYMIRFANSTQQWVEKFIRQ